MRALVVGETWTTVTTVVNGANSFPGRSVGQDSSGWLVGALRAAEIDVDHLPSHEVVTGYPDTPAGLDRYDAVVIGDVGADSFSLTDTLYTSAAPQTDRLRLTERYVALGGGLLMIGGYMSFSGIAGTAGYGRSPLGDVLPVVVSTSDDRVERPGGGQVTVDDPSHPALDGVPTSWPPLLGYNAVAARPAADVPVRIDGAPLLALHAYGRGRAAAFTSDCAPHWASSDFLGWSGYGRLFANVIRWLAAGTGAEG